MCHAHNTKHPAQAGCFFCKKVKKVLDIPSVAAPPPEAGCQTKNKKSFFKKVVDGMFLVSYTDPRYER
jgi:hypothetical protein